MGTYPYMKGIVDFKMYLPCDEPLKGWLVLIFPQSPLKALYNASFLALRFSKFFFLIKYKPQCVSVKFGNLCLNLLTPTNTNVIPIVSNSQIIFRMIYLYFSLNGKTISKIDSNEHRFKAMFFYALPKHLQQN